MVTVMALVSNAQSQAAQVFSFMMPSFFTARGRRGAAVYLRQTFPKKQ
jgi:hypothetical protein